MISMPNSVEAVMRIGKAFSDSTRIRALLALRNGELCVCQLVTLLNLAPSTVSKHMSILKQAGLVESRKDSRWVYYRLITRDDTDNTSEVYGIVQSVMKILKNDPLIDRDNAAMKKIRSAETQSLCRQLRKTEKGAR